MRFRIYLHQTIQGPLEVSQIKLLPEFTPKNLVCPEGDDDWRAAESFPVFTREEPAIVNEAPQKAPKRDWRTAVIGGDIPEMNLRPYTPPASPSAARPPSAPTTSAKKAPKMDPR